jgi:hypothetical protein
MTVAITDYYLHNVSDPNKVSKSALEQAGYSCCTLPPNYNFRKAYVTAVELVGSKNFLTIDSDLFWFQSAALAVQFRLML